MLKLTLSRPSTVGTILTKRFDSYSSAEDYLERKVESLADKGYECSELTGSNSRNGTIECVSDFEADILVIEWTTVT
jgi:hypothetical protein